MKFKVVVGIPFLAALTFASEVTFEAYMAIDSGSLFVISSGKENQSSWIRVGQVFDGVRIVKFDGIAEVLTVEKNGKQQALRLRESRVRDDQSERERRRLLRLSSLAMAREMAKTDPNVAMLVKRHDLLELEAKNLLESEDRNGLRQVMPMLSGVKDELQQYGEKKRAELSRAN